MSEDEFVRLIGRGLNPNVALDVIDGKLDEEFAVARAIEVNELAEWQANLLRPPEALTAQWDLDPSHFYLVYDGDRPDLHPGVKFTLIAANVADVHEKLTHYSSREKTPWDDEYRDRSEGTAFRWLKGKPVTPPLINRVESQIAIQGGNHRYHLAHYYKTERMPFLVLNRDLASVLDLIASAIVVPIPQIAESNGARPRTVFCTNP